MKKNISAKSFFSFPLRPLRSLRLNLLQSVLFSSSVVFLCGCTRTVPPTDYYVASIVDSRIDKCVQWNQTCHEDADVICAIEWMLNDELTIDTAVQIALLNNPEIQATFEEIGISHADLVEAGLFRNPVFDGYVRFPDRHSLVLNTEFSVAQSFLDVFLIPLRKKIAEVELEQAQLRVSNAVLNLAFDVQKIFYSLQAEEARNHVLEEIVLAAEAASELAKGQSDQGNINSLELQNHVDAYVQTKIELSTNQIELVRLKEEMNKLLGLSYPNWWKICSELMPLPPCEKSDVCLESIAVVQRLDLAVARWDVERIARMLGIKEWWANTDVYLGVSSEREAEGFRETGPAFSAAIPIFNYGQADRERLHAMYRQKLQRYRALEIQILADVRAAQEIVLIQRKLVEAYQNELMPLRGDNLSFSQRYYNSMALGVYKLLDSKTQALRAQILHTAALKKYWLARVELNRAVGGMATK